MDTQARWTVKVSKETDIAVRTHLAEEGGRKGDLSKFIERAVQKEVIRETSRSIRKQNDKLPEADVQAIIDEACSDVRATFWENRHL
jgi:Ribbon-helix-helix domain